VPHVEPLTDEQLNQQISDTFPELFKSQAPWCTSLDTGERQCLLGLMRKMLRSRGGR